MASHIRVYNHIPALVGLDNTRFVEQVERLKVRLARSNPVAILTRRTIGGATSGLETAIDRDVLLRQLLDRNPSRIARKVLVQLTDWLPPRAGRVTCHLVPNGGDRGSGNCFGAERLLVTVPCKGDAAAWMSFVIAHEYSHTQRGFRLADSDTVRDFLVFEGLAMVLAETIAPAIGNVFRQDATDEQVASFWAEVDLEGRGLDGYMRQMAREGAYEAGARIVRAYLQRHDLSIVDAHYLQSEGLYWGSSYPLLR